jgi:hypothetical protein
VKEEEEGMLGEGWLILTYVYIPSSFSLPSLTRPNCNLHPDGEPMIQRLYNILKPGSNNNIRLRRTTTPSILQAGIGLETPRPISNPAPTPLPSLPFPPHLLTPAHAERERDSQNTQTQGRESARVFQGQENHFRACIQLVIGKGDGNMGIS